MKSKKWNWFLILDIALYVVMFSILFIHDCFDNNINYKTLPFVSGYYIVVVILYFSVINITYNISCNNKRVLLKKLQIHQQLNKLDKQNKLNDFLDFCLNKNNKLLISEILQELTNPEKEKVDLLIKENNYKAIKEYLLSISSDKRKNLKKLVSDFDIPYCDDYFLNYYNHTLLKKKESIFGFISGFISLVIAIIPFVLTELVSISLGVYLDFASPLILLVFDIPKIISRNVKNNINELNNDLKELEEYINEFNETQHNCWFYKILHRLSLMWLHQSKPESSWLGLFYCTTLF